MSKRLSLIFCGSCNASVDLGRIAQEITACLNKEQFTVSYNRSDADFIVYLSGCMVNCAKRDHPAALPGVTVTADKVNGVRCEEPQIGSKVAEIIRSYQF